MIMVGVILLMAIHVLSISVTVDTFLASTRGG
jgi:hypothetical protein